MKGQAEKRLDLRMGRLEAFVATARYLSYERAAAELGSSLSRVKHDVLRLEGLLHKLLIIDDGPIELYHPDGTGFLPIAIEALRSLQTFVRRPPATSAKRSPLSQIRLSDLRSIGALRSCRTFIGAAYELGCSPDQVRRNVKKLERIFGSVLLTGRSEIRLSEEGNRLTIATEKIDADIKASVATIFEKSDSFGGDRRLFYRFAVRRRMELFVIIKRANKKIRQSERDRIFVEAAQQELKFIEPLIEAASPPYRHTSGRDIIIE